MKDPNFIDQIRLHLKAGHGGAGSAHLHRARYVPKGGPDGGDGGRGGHIILRGNAHMSTLLPLKYRKHIRANSGQPGGAQHCTGASGEDIILDVPLGTVAYGLEDEEGTLPLCRIEIMEAGQTHILARGGLGGRGNAHYKSPTNRTPRYAQPGTPGEEGWVVLELKLLADVGLIGLPNAGKSTLLSVISAAKPKIANYPFTTLVPQLGVVPYHDRQSFVVADIPGLIEGAAEGRGLGVRFLRHAERNTLLLMVVAADDADVITTYHLLRKELLAYHPSLAAKPHRLVLSKMDLLDAVQQNSLKKQLRMRLPQVEPLWVSSATSSGLKELKIALWEALHPILEKE